jgi:hypothetical protein
MSRSDANSLNLKNHLSIDRSRLRRYDLIPDDGYVVSVELEE